MLLKKIGSYRHKKDHINKLMDINKEIKIKKHITIGLLAHVDAGKTTLTEALLYNNKMIRSLGRVDHRDTFLDTDPIERQRGITVSSKQARIISEGCEYLLLDTPGHSDLAAEMERTLWVLDYAILLVSAQEGITTQVRYLFKMLETYNVPTFIFVNKTDSAGFEKDGLMDEIKKELSSSAIDFNNKDDEFYEHVALTDESLLNKFLDGSAITNDDIANLIKERKLFAVRFGSALKNTGIEEFFEDIKAYTRENTYREGLSGRVYKISRDEKGTRLVWLKLTGGRLKVKQLLPCGKNDDELGEKVDQIRLYSGSGYKTADEAFAGMLCTVTGIRNINAGDSFGDDKELGSLITEPILTYEIEHDESVQTITVFDALKKIEEEEPKLSVSLSQRTGRISVKVMGRVQMEILKVLMKSRFDIDIDFGASTIVYKETIKRAVEGVGHFEPLRHYAEVRLMIEPLEAGSGVVLENRCSRDELDIHWQKLIMSHLAERTHTGILADSRLTDMRISLVGGRAHTKHTEPGDFRQATFRALRQGLMETVSVLLEPYLKFVITIPQENVGRVLFDLNGMEAENEPPIVINNECQIFGKGPASRLSGYQEELTVFTSGRGRIVCTLAGYEECKDAEDVIKKIGYDADADLENTSSSVFCSHGAGVIVPWYNVKDRMHTESTSSREQNEEESPAVIKNVKAKNENLSFKEQDSRIEANEKELEEIFSRTYGKRTQSTSRPGWKKASRLLDTAPVAKKKRTDRKPGKEYLLVDGYNIIFAWQELKEMADTDISAARDKLMDIMSDFAGMLSGTLILVYDAYKVPGGREAVSKYHNIYVVYTKESETADQYIEKTVHDLGKNNNVTVATSDGLEQVIVLGEGAVRMSALGLLEAVKNSKKQLKKDYLGENITGRAFLSEFIPKEIHEALRDKKDIADEKIFE